MSTIMIFFTKCKNFWTDIYLFVPSEKDIHITPHSTIIQFTSPVRIDGIAKEVVGDLAGNGGGDAVMIHLTPLEKISSSSADNSHSAANTHIFLCTLMRVDFELLPMIASAVVSISSTSVSFFSCIFTLFNSFCLSGDKNSIPNATDDGIPAMCGRRRRLRLFTTGFCICAVVGRIECALIGFV